MVEVGGEWWGGRGHHTLYSKQLTQRSSTLRSVVSLGRRLGTVAYWSHDAGDLPADGKDS